MLVHIILAIKGLCEKHRCSVPAFVLCTYIRAATMSRLIYRKWIIQLLWYLNICFREIMPKIWWFQIIKHANNWLQLWLIPKHENKLRYLFIYLFFDHIALWMKQWGRPAFSHTVPEWDSERHHNWPLCGCEGKKKIQAIKYKLINSFLLHIYLERTNDRSQTAT